MIEPREAAVAVISKVPRLGHSKTRLARALGEDTALALHRAFLRDELGQLHQPALWQLYLVHDAPVDAAGEVELRSLLSEQVRGLAPGGATLGQELLGAFESLLRRHRRAVLVSGDVPQITTAVVQAALRALDEVDVVLGPGPDGGYSLVALRAPHDLFTGVLMGGGAVLKATQRRAGELGLSLRLLAPMADMDEAQDLLALEHAPPKVAHVTRSLLSGIQRGELALQLPRELQVEVSSRCNLRCAACLTSHEQLAPGADLDLARFRELIKGIPQLDRVAFQLNGEPLLAPELPVMIELAKRRGAVCVLNSNGTLLDARRRAALLAAGLDELRISLDGACAETVASLVGADVFDRVIRDVAAFVRERGSRRGPRLSFWMVASSRSLPELPALVRLAARLGVEEVYVQRLVLTGRGLAVPKNSLHGRLSDELRGVIATAEALAAELGVALRASGRQSVIDSLRPSAEGLRGCWRPWRSAVLTAQGKVLPCCISSFTTPYDRLELGDRRRQGWTEIWNGPRYRALRRGILDGDPAESCIGCGELWSL